MSNKLKSEKKEVIFFRPKWDVMSAMKWLGDHNITPLKSPDTKMFENQIRFRITDPTIYKEYTSKRLVKDGKPLFIQLILGWK